MAFHVVEVDTADVHHWAHVETDPCDLEDPNDALVTATVGLVRRAYGEDRMLQIADQLVETNEGNLSFDTDHLTAAIRMGLPDPAAEGEKPEQLTVYRSQSAEMVAIHHAAISSTSVDDTDGREKTMPPYSVICVQRSGTQSALFWHTPIRLEQRWLEPPW